MHLKNANTGQKIPQEARSPYEVLAPEDIEREFGLSRAYARRLLIARKIRPVKMGKRWGATRQDVINHILDKPKIATKGRRRKSTQSNQERDSPR